MLSRRFSPQFSRMLVPYCQVDERQLKGSSMSDMNDVSQSRVRQSLSFGPRPPHVQDVMAVRLPRYSASKLMFAPWIGLTKGRFPQR